MNIIYMQTIIQAVTHTSSCICVHVTCMYKNVDIYKM